MIELLLIGAAPLPSNPLLETFVTETVIEQKIELPKELTVEEKIASDYYKCEPLRYIRKDTAECGDIRPEYRVSERRSSAKDTRTPVANKNATTASYGWYSPKQCTGYVASRRSVGQWGNASTWPSYARKEGYYVGSTPVAGAIGQRGNHVVYIERVEGDQVYISERNYDYKGSYREMYRPISYYTYIY